MKKVIIVCFAFLVSMKVVYAAEVMCDSEKNELLITDKNNCISNNSEIINNTCDGDLSYKIDPDKPLNVSYTVPDPTPPNPNAKPFKVFVLVDDSNSMSSGSKIANVRGSLKNLALGVKQINDNSRIVVKYFYSNLTSEKSISSYITDRDYNDVNAGNKSTNYVEGLGKAITYFNSLKNSADKDKYVPLVVFITDGYPNVLNSGPTGWSSSARHFYAAAKKFKEVRNLINSIDSRAKVITVGIDIGGSSTEDYMPNYLLGPTDDSYEKLQSGIDANGEVNLEAAKLYEMMNSGTGNKEFNEVVMTIGGYPDKGIVGSTDETTKRKMVFRKIGVLRNNAYETLKSTDLGQGGGLIFGPFRAQSGLSTSHFTIKYDNTTFNVGHNRFDLVGDGNWKYLRVKFSSRSEANKILHANKVVVNVSRDLTYNTYKRSGSFSHNSYKGLSNKYFPGVLSDIPVQEWKNALSQSNDGTGDKQCLNKSVSGSQRDHKLLCENKNIAIGRYCYNNSGRDVTVPIVLDEATSFDGGTIKNIEDPIIAGRGFKFQGITLNNTVTWQFTYKGVRASNPVVANQVPLVKFGDSYVRFDELTILNGSCTNNKAFGSIDALKSEINKKLFDTDGIVDNYSNSLKNRIKSGFITVNFNNRDEERNDIVEIIKYDNDAIAGGRKYEYHIAAKRIMNDGHYKFKYANDSVLDTELSTPGTDRYYYLPFGYNKDNAKVYVKFDSFATYNVICPITVDNPDDPRKNVHFRTIDVSDPFPNSNYQSNKIPANWRDWYCDGSGCSNTISSPNKNRLKNSYNKIFYEVYVSKLNNYVEHGYYSKIDSIDDSGRSSFINNYNYFNINSAVVNKNYCGYGVWNQNCDEVG
ncbi:MAG: vWA domain-containing protein [Bacilli bacterium]|nr:vWA domain-containing protein [Bacilli bacterium]